MSLINGSEVADVIAKATSVERQWMRDRGLVALLSSRVRREKLMILLQK